MRKLIFLFTLATAVPLMAVSTSHWTQTSETDFKTGTLHNVVATNLGEVKLSRSVKTLLEEDPKVSMVTALAHGKDGVIYAGTAPQGLLLQVVGEKVSTVATIDDAVSITALLAQSDGGLLIGVSGETGRVLKIDKPGDKPREIFSAKDVQYVWGLAQSPDGVIYAATGPNGQLFSIGTDGKSQEIYKSDENNLTALVSDENDLLYVGTDPDAMVVRINRKTKDSFVMYNADEEEITSLALDADGTVYAATGQSITPQPGQGVAENQSKGETGGRPQAPTETPLPSQPPKPPQPPQQPGPTPGQPPPIPQKPTAMWWHERRSDVIPVLLAAETTEGGSAEAGPGDQPAPPSVPGIPAAPGGANPADVEGGKAAPPGGKNGHGQGEGEPKPLNNAIYKIDKDGFVTEIFRQPVVIYSMVESHGVLLVGTGNDGEIYQVDPAAQETVVLAKTDAKQVTSMLAAADGGVVLGLSNTGSIGVMTSGYADSGTYVSPVLDASQISRFGVIQMHGSLPKPTTLTVATRVGNVKDADSQGWSKWTEEAPALEYLPIKSPAARFLQYRITFKTTDPTQTPVIKDMDVAYQMPHLAPVIKAIKVADAPPAQPPQPAGGGKPADAKPAGTGTQVISWEAASPDGDALVYSLYFRTAPGGQWILLKEKLTDATFTWDTKTVADGRYEVKVVASDAAANPPGDGKTSSRVSDVLVVDNTPPVIGDLKVTAAVKSARIDLRVTDAASTVASLEYCVDSNDGWQSVLPVDKIFDQPEETVAISVDNLTPGAHQITLRATDAHGNVAYQTVAVTVGEK